MNILALISGLSILSISTVDDIKQTDYTESAIAINMLLREHHYNPAELESAPYLEIEEEVLALARTATSEKEFLTGFRAIWQDGPFSHVVLRKAQGTAAELADHLDSLLVGDDGAGFTWDGGTAILTVNTMIGSDTIAAIEAAYVDIAEKGADKLIIDLRQNDGGAFAVRPLIEHLIDTPYASGAFVAQRWNAAHDAPPAFEDVQSVAPWSGWSLISFWQDVQSEPFIWLQFEPAQPYYGGPVFVLTSSRTASAAELAADALKGSGRATLIGEVTAGKMLSQKPFDVPGSFHLFLPIADYYSFANGRIEGHGVTPEIETGAEMAMETALTQ